MFRMTPNILRNLITEKATRFYPYEVRNAFPGVRGELANDIEKCTFCGVCAMKCPTKCIAVDKKAGTWSCDPSVCVYCGVCVGSCVKKSLSQIPAYRKPGLEKKVLFLKGTPPPPKAGKEKGEAGEGE